MARKKQPTAASATATGTIIGSGIVIENALFKGSGTVRIDGKFQGEIDIDGRFILGETGMVSGDTQAENALLAGKFQGNLNVKDTLHITSSAVLSGRIVTGKMIIDEGGVFNGACNMLEENNYDLEIQETGPHASQEV